MSSSLGYSKRQDEARKKQSGAVPPDRDEDGKMINPHNPDFITKVPWYLGESGPTLKHHNVQKKDHKLSIEETDLLLKIKDSKPSVGVGNLVFKKGACKNCGAMTHKEKDCVERPRSSRKAAWKSGLDIAPDEVVVRLEDHGKVDYAAKRDNWQGYDPEEYRDTVERFNRIEAERQRYKQEQREQRRKERELTKEKKETASSDSDSSSVSDSEAGGAEDEDRDEFVQRDELARDFQGRTARQGGVGGAQHKVTVRNLRLREDTPKYLHNLDLESAFYDPKARSMRDNPLPNKNPEDLVFAGDNFVRQSGDAVELAKTQVLCWDMQANGESVDLISNPSQAYLLKKQYEQKKAVEDVAKKKALMEKYGGEEYLQVDPKLRLGQTEVYNEYSRDGRIVKGPGRAPTKTKYEEDVYINNHTSVWGSYFNKNKWAWGYACCHSLVKNSYCVGEAKREVNDNANNQVIDEGQQRRMLESKPVSERKATVVTKRSDVYGEGSAVELDEAKVREALTRQEGDEV